MSEETQKQLALAALHSSKTESVTDRAIARDYDRKTKVQKHWLRWTLFVVVAGLMVMEVGLMFLVVFLQGFGGLPWTQTWKFKLDQWVLASFEAGVLIQTFALAKIITVYLFSNEQKP